MSDHDGTEEEIGICRQEPDGQAQIGSDSRLIRGQSSTPEGQRPTAIKRPSAQALPVTIIKKRQKTSSKLIVSAEISQGLWDAVQQAVDSGRYPNVSELVRRAVARELGKPVRLG